LKKRSLWNGICYDISWKTLSETSINLAVFQASSWAEKLDRFAGRRHADMKFMH
jgi:hypothetical protein